MLQFIQALFFLYGLSLFYLISFCLSDISWCHNIGEILTPFFPSKSLKCHKLPGPIRPLNPHQCFALRLSHLPCSLQLWSSPHFSQQIYAPSTTKWYKNRICYENKNIWICIISAMYVAGFKLNLASFTCCKLKLFVRLLLLVMGVSVGWVCVGGGVIKFLFSSEGVI
jgi:hypothetical protein